MSASYIEKISELTFSVHHNPNCASPFQVRLIGHGQGRLDNIHGRQTKDICGHGQSLEEAASDAWQKKFTQQQAA